MRMADGMITQVHPSSIKIYNNEDSDWVSQIPPEVVEILGRPLTRESLLELSKKDELPAIYSEDVLPQIVEPPDTRQRRSVNAKLEQAILDQEGEDPDFEDITPNDLETEGKTVTFENLD